MVKTITIERPIWTKSQTVKATVLIEHVNRGHWRITGNDPRKFGQSALRTNKKDAVQRARMYYYEYAEFIDGKVPNLFKGEFSV